MFELVLTKHTTFEDLHPDFQAKQYDRKVRTNDGENIKQRPWQPPDIPFVVVCFKANIVF